MPKIPRFPPSARTVEFLAFPDFQLLDVTGPLQVFASANDWAAGQGHPAPYRVRTVALAKSVASTAGLAVACGRLPTARQAVDTLVVSGGRGVHAAAQEPRLVRWIANRASDARRVVSICTGAFLLGAAGLLDGRRVATHWSDCDALARLHPAAKVEPDPIYVADGKIWSSAGVTAGIDLALALVEADIGHAAAIAVARDLVVFLKRPGGQAQFSAALALQGGDRFADLHGWIAGHLRARLDVPALAARAGMSERSFVRRYGQETGLTPARAVERIRVEAARQVIATTSLSVKSVVARCGFGSPETMRRAFLRQIGATPQAYRVGFGRDDAGAPKKIRMS